MANAHWAYLVFLSLAFPGMAAGSFQRYQHDGNLFSLTVAIGCMVGTGMMLFQLYKRFKAKRDSFGTRP